MQINFTQYSRLKFQLIMISLLISIEWMLFLLFGQNTSFFSVFDSFSGFIRIIVFDRFIVEILTWLLLSMAIIQVGRKWFSQLETKHPFALRYVVKFAMASFIPLILVILLGGVMRSSVRTLFFEQTFTLLPIKAMLKYAIPYSIVVIISIIYNLIYNYNLSETLTPSITEKAKEKESYLEVLDSTGKKWIQTSNITWIEKKNRLYHVNCDTASYRINMTLRELEERLPETLFTRVNRAVIANIGELDTYSFWENDKYIVRLRNGQEFIISRERLKKLKAHFTQG